jgi:chemotaxis regulatin CheY-phosphate phosphatase CheZ
MKNKSIKHITIQNNDRDRETIERLTNLVRELTETLAQIVGYDKPISAASTYDCYK